MASDTFTAADNTDISTLTNWNIGDGNIKVTSNAARAVTSGGGPHYYYSGTFANNQGADITLSDVTNTHGQIGPNVRKAASSAVTLYGYEIYSTGREFYKRVAGAYTGLGATTLSATPANGDVARIEASGTTITAKYNGSTDSSIGAPVTDSSIASGQVGIGGWSDGSGSLGADSWSGADLTGGAAIGSNVLQARALVGTLRSKVLS